MGTATVLIDLKYLILQGEFMREIRLEENINETVLPPIMEFDTSFDKNHGQMETPKLAPKNQHNTACESVKSNYREDIGGE